MSRAWQEDAAAASRAGRDRRSADRIIVEQVRQAVLAQRLPPGTRLPETTLGEVFGVSRSVVRKALTRLAAEHVVSQRPNQVARVRAPSVAETRDTFAARRLVEGEVVALLAGRLDAEALNALEARVSHEAEAYAASDETARIEHSLAIHHMLAERSPNRVLGTMLTDLILRTSIVIALYKHPRVASCYLPDDHPALLAHLRNGEAEAARQGIHGHLHALEERLELGSRDASPDLMAIFARHAAV